MNKIVKTLVFSLLLCFQQLFSQGLQESLDWINSKRLEGFDYFSGSVAVASGNRLQVTPEKIRIENDKGDIYTWFSWSTINDLRINDDEAGKNILYIVSNYIHEGLPLYIGIHFKTKELRDRFSKAVQHVAKLQGGPDLIYDNYDASKSNAVTWLKSRGIDVFEGDNKLRLDITESQIKKYFLKATDFDIIQWKDVKEIKSEVYDKNKKYYRIQIIGPTDDKGNIKIIKFYVFQNIASKYVNALNSLAVKNGASLVKDNLF
ncbi:hypothetical protein [Chryseobacterium oryctis]|uniref:Uncharacterized protein n=1 Tax=Chryseobacterium oryctis TaxID=2952618 RepID=A0ABT3HSR0_9FLAO|nr:hypothetical protein [Chryseobacterium oryctis]MCW3162813.1 hypothetical protein [Chryseobacterium oryctis]